jgi:Xaa-Pro aminopeptidase
MANVCIAALDAVVARVRPSNTPETVDRACRPVIADAGMLHHYRKRTGHLTGIAFAPD